jgi:hypothetical protein
LTRRQGNTRGIIKDKVTDEQVLGVTGDKGMTGYEEDRVTGRQACLLVTQAWLLVTEGRVFSNTFGGRYGDRGGRERGHEINKKATQ